MNTRQAIQPSNTPAVLNLSFSASRNRFIAALSNGLRVFRSDNCLTTYRPLPDTLLPEGSGIAIAAALDDRYIAFVAGGRTAKPRSGNVVVWWDCVLEREVSRSDFYEPVKGVRVCGKWMVVILLQRTVVFEYHELQPQQQPTPPLESEDDDEEPETLKGPNRAKSIHQTSANTFALGCLSNTILALPAQAVGQVQLVPLPSGSKRVFRAHNTALRCLGLSPDGKLLATASEQGTLIRVFSTSTLNQVAEFRRGVEKAIIHSLAFSDGGRWLAVTSNKGTVHVFDLRPPPATEPANAKSVQQQHRKTSSVPHHRLSTGGEKSSQPSVSGRSSPSATPSAPYQGYQGSIQEYYGLRPPPSSASPTHHTAAITALSAFKSSSFAPRIMKDVRSVASMPFYTGNDPQHWQGGARYSWTMAPGGTRKRVWNVVHSLPNDPVGRPGKGVVAFRPRGKGDGKEEEEEEEEDGATFWVIGGGSDARWEMFDLLPKEGGGWGLVNRGFRRFLERQFVD